MAADNERDEWWRKMSITEFANELEGLTTKDQESLVAELGSVSAIVSATVQDKTKDPDERNRARYFLAKVSEKRKLVIAKLQASGSHSREAKRSAAEDMLEYAEERVSTDPAEAMRQMIAAMRMMWGLGEDEE